MDERIVKDGGNLDLLLYGTIFLAITDHESRVESLRVKTGHVAKVMAFL